MIKTSENKIIGSPTLADVKAISGLKLNLKMICQKLVNHFRIEFLTLDQCAGWNNGHCWTMNEIYKMLPKDEVERVEKIEFLDEKELVSQLFDHYCVSYGWKNKSNINFFGDIEFWND